MKFYFDFYCSLSPPPSIRPPSVQVLPTIPKEQRTRVAHFLEQQGFKQQALAVSTDVDHKFELAMQLKDLRIGYELAKKLEVGL